MAPPDISDMSSTTNNQTLSLPKLKGDSSNWATYSERILNYLTSKGFRRHVQGTARKPEILSERNGSYYKSGSLAPLSDEELEKHEDSVDSYDQSQAAVREVIYRTIDKTHSFKSRMRLTPLLCGRKLYQFMQIGGVSTRRTF